ncbi:D-alanyl-D-alanine carboxypeptidase [Fodinisporobacter ferrooxydans]|uniref:serine-type D-Ala-D-Ala carboxypeptidase n=1 Tax=Fodinisporobacter ferrooxydans TaxID=2901836 RepID=A0ABY4CH96_9BACL|nr:D-alanyl-D-alanine carboxypeptidase [Alicyclobacillaceae bacterium MYW30-H2]
MARIRLRMFFSFFVILAMFSMYLPQVNASEVSLAKQSQAAVLMDVATGTVLFEKESHKHLPIASVTKIMTMLLVMEAVDTGKIKLSDKIRTSEHAASMGGSQIYLEPGEEMTLNDMLKGIAIGSANDACVAVAERIAGTEEAFVAMMNKKVQELGMKDTHFANTNGLPANDHYSSAYDIAIMSRALLQHEKITHWTSVYSDYLRKDSEKPLWLVNTNKLVKFYPGMDGLKTGFTAEAKYCLAATAKRDQFRVVAVVLGAPTSPIRNQQITQLMDFAFSQYHSQLIYKANQVVEKVKISKGKQDSIELVAEKPLGVLMKKGEQLTGIQKQVVVTVQKAPVHKGQVIGYITIAKDGKELGRVNLLANQEIEKANLWDMVKRTFRGVVFFGR